MKVYEDVHSAYLGTLADVVDSPDYVCSPRGMQIREKLDYQFRVMKPEAVSLVTKDEERNGKIAEYTAKEMELYNSGTNKASDFAQASKFWSTIANPDGTINSAYGYLIWKNKSMGSARFEKEHNFTYDTQFPKRRTPWEWAKECLILDKDTRQAIMPFNLPDHAWLGNKDFPCTLVANWHIRENQLHLAMVMRSNDLNRGLLYDLNFFVSLMDRMVDELKPTYPDIVKGHYTHTAQSAHIYEKELPVINKMLGRETTV